MLIPISACVALAALSLLLPSEPSYDPWAWLVWGREIAHLELDTEGGPSWKPLPVALLALVTPLGDDLPVVIWVAIARAGALLAMVLAYRLAARLAGGSAPLRAVAGATAAAFLFLTPDWFQLAAHASEAPLAVALMLWGVERHLDGRRGHALALGALVCLKRPELFPFLALYGLWLAWIEPGRRRTVAALLVAIPLAWVVPEWIGSGDPLDGGSQARSEPYWSLSHAERPWLRALERVHNHAGLPVEVLAAVALVSAAALRRRGAHATALRRRADQAPALTRRAAHAQAVPALAAAAALEAALFVGMTQAGFSGNPRYVLPALTVLCVLAGVGAARTAQAAAGAGRAAIRRLSHPGVPYEHQSATVERCGARPRVSTGLSGAVRPQRGAALPRLPGLSEAAAGIAVVALLATPLIEHRVGRLEFEAREVGRRMELQRDLARAVDAAGGPEALRALGSATTNRALHSRLAWELGHPIQDVERGYGHRVVLRTSEEALAGNVLVWGTAGRRQLLGRAGSFDVYRRIGISYRLIGVSHRLFTSPLQGFDIRLPVGGNAGTG
jgi:hypothetical protein